MSTRPVPALAALAAFSTSLYLLPDGGPAAPPPQAERPVRIDAAPEPDELPPGLELGPGRSRLAALSPAPTENWLEDDAEETQKQRRKAWFRELHKAPPGVDWQAIERANGLAQIAKRNALAAPPPGPEAEDPLLGGAWVERGSENQAGRMHVARHSPDGAQIFAGSSKGGVWMGTPDGGDWTPIGDNLYGGAHWLEVVPGATEEDPPIVFAATDSGLLHYSDDLGETWIEPTGIVGVAQSVRRLVATSEGSYALFLVYRDSGGTNTVYRSEDGGASWVSVFDMGSYEGDLWAPRDGGDTIFLVASDGVWTSGDLGESWENVAGLPASRSQGAELAASEAGAPRLWLIIDDRSLYRSDDAGGSWSYLGNVSDYWGALNASITDEDVFSWGGMELYVTADGGERFNKVDDWWAYYDSPADTLHADMMGIDVALDDKGQELWYIGTDGGLYRSLDQLDTVENLSLTGLRVSQYYGTLTSNIEPYNVAAGAQDQGYQVTNGLTQAAHELDFDQILSGDYAHLTSGDGTHELVYSVYPGFVLVQLGEENPQLGYLNFPGGEYYAWLPPVVADPDDPEIFYLCARYLYRYARDSRGQWNPERWSAEQVSSGTYDYISGLRFSPVNPDRAYAATNYGGLLVSDDRGVTWTKSEVTGPYPQYFYGHAIVASALDEDVALVGGSGYGATSIWRTDDGGATWTEFDQGLPETLVYSLGEAPDGSGALFAGTETAVYRRDLDDTEWTDITGDVAPVTTYWSVEALSYENTMRFGTYGRGIWDYQLDPENTPCYPVVDGDLDGFDCLEDCEDAEIAIFPGAEELCDGIDQNCDPEDLVEEDADGDGFLACEECDDGDPGRAPGLKEVCGDGIDQDCDGEDEACPPEPEDTDPPEQEDTDPPEEEPPEDDNEGDGGSGYPDAPPPMEAKSCGCASGGAGGGALVLPLLLGLLTRRREQTGALRA
jgi:photosystem II stability/assembly factor-like uncharacterized protein